MMTATQQYGHRTKVMAWTETWRKRAKREETGQGIDSFCTVLDHIKVKYKFCTLSTVKQDWPTNIVPCQRLQHLSNQSIHRGPDTRYF